MTPKVGEKILFFCFLLLIAAGIIVKRVYHHREFMMLFHLPAGIFLVLFLRLLMRGKNQIYRKEIEAVRRPSDRRFLGKD